VRGFQKVKRVRCIDHALRASHCFTK
jgi:hypothetical protein